MVVLWPLMDCWVCPAGVFVFDVLEGVFVQSGFSGASGFGSLGFSSSLSFYFCAGILKGDDVVLLSSS